MLVQLYLTDGSNHGPMCMIIPTKPDSDNALDCYSLQVSYICPQRRKVHERHFFITSHSPDNTFLKGGGGRLK